MDSIVTLTMNPALDITVAAEAVRPTEKIRCSRARYDAGGGGINVAKIAHVLGAPVTAVFPAGGASGDLVSRLVAETGVPFRRIDIAEPTRESFTIDETGTGLQYRFVLPGPRLTPSEQAGCVNQLRVEATSAQFVVASGSLPPGAPADFYQRIADVCGEAGVRFVLDTSGAGLQHVHRGVSVLKASVRELRECVGRDLTTESEQLDAAHELVDSGRAEAAVVSLGAQGALLATRTDSCRFAAIPMRAVSGVGAGDAMVAGITVALTRGWPLSTSVRFGMAAGAAMLMTPGTAPCTRADTERLFEIAEEPVEVAVVCG
ncbi:MAG: 1-phosphofructokinase family hexose kinase [Mycobacterium sp.]